MPLKPTCRASANRLRLFAAGQSNKAEANRTTGGLTHRACKPRDDIRAGIGAKRRERHGYPLAGERLCPAPFLYSKEGVGEKASAPSMQTERSDKLREVEGEGAVECF